MSVIIIGGGMAGASLALALSNLTKGQVAIDLVEAQELAHHQHPGFDARAIALAQGTCQQLDTVNLWSALADKATPIETIHISDRGHSGLVTLDAKRDGLPAFGQVIELHDAGARLFALLRKAPGVTLHCPAKMLSVTRTIDSAKVTLDNGTELSGQLLVAADGSFSSLGHALQINWQQYDYQQIALTANVTMSEAHAGRAFERFTPNGPLALLPMSDNRCSLVWCHPASAHHEVKQWDDRQFCQELQRAFGWRLGAVEQVGKRHSYPLVLRTAQQHTGHRLVLVGNAAQTLHPIAGQGFNLGLRDVMVLAKVLAEAMRKGQDLGSYQTIGDYGQCRKADQQATIALTDGLIHLFANDLLPLAVVRNLAMMAIDNCALLRHRLMCQTLGQFKK